MIVAAHKCAKQTVLFANDDQCIEFLRALYVRRRALARSEAGEGEEGLGQP
jgi:hypothetical protein